MRAYAGIFIIISLVLLVGTVGAAIIPDTVTVSTNKPWVTANNLDQSTITITVTNTTFGAVQGSIVSLGVNDTLYGTLSTTTVTTDISGTATSTFKVKTRSGAALITATTSGKSGSVIQNIDHDSPYFPYFAHPLNGTVATEVPFNISVTDRWGNRIDNLRPNQTHSVSLHVHGPSPDNVNFVGYGHDLVNQPLDPNGNLSLRIKLTNKIGNNYILMDSFGSISDKVEVIEAVTAGIPYSMTGKISDGGILPADNQAFFIIDYFLYDVYGNPMNNRTIWVNTSLTGPQEQELKTSNSLGQIQLKYGPKVAVNNITITAISIDNQSVSNLLHAEFINSGATNMVLAITPQVLASREIPTYQPAQVVGKVTDFVGNPVSGETVTFEFTAPVNFPADVPVTGAPSFSSTSVVTKINATTNGDGNAIVYFYPGSFTIQQSDPHYSDKASGSSFVSATWKSNPSINPPIRVEWKNYPYLTVSVNATPQTVKVNDTVNVSINVRGDGYMMQQRPITVILDLESTSNMKANNNGTTRLDDMRGSSETFVNNLTVGQDQVGLTTFGEITDNTGLILSPSYNFVQVISNLYNLTPKGGSKNMDQSIDNATSLIIGNPTLHPHEVRAIIIAGDQQPGPLAPLVQETWTDNNIHVFTILFVSSKGGTCDTSDSKVLAMQQLAALAGGKSYCVASKNAMDVAFADIAQVLKSLAGVNATMDLSFQNVEVNSTPMSGGLVFDYVPETKTTWPNATVTYANQSNEWIPPGYQLHFTIGTIHVGEVWQADYRLKVKQTGVIKLFGPGSIITFNNGTESLNLPEVFITSVPNATPQGTQSGILDVSNLVVTKSGNISDYAPLKWNMKYTGFTTATEKLYYSYNNGPWVPLTTITGIAPGDYVHTTQVDVKKFPQGSYQIKVQAVASDSPDDEEITALFNVGGRTISIKLE
jgi:hypothetical protein